MAHSHNPSTEEVETGGLEVQAYPWRHSEYKASLGFIQTCLKKKKSIKHHSKYFELYLFILSVCVYVYVYVHM